MIFTGITRQRLLIVLLAAIVIALAALGLMRAIDYASEVWLRVPELILGYDVAASETLASASVSPAKLLARERERVRADMVWKIYGLESSYGRNDGCKARGEGYNGWGWRQNSFEWICFKTQKEVIQAVHNWIEQKQQLNWPISRILCFYNQGVIVDDCEYYRKYLTLD